MGRIWNFSAGPAALPEEVLAQARDELLDWHGAGCGVMEMSHRGKEFTSIIETAEADLHDLRYGQQGKREVLPRMRNRFDDHLSRLHPKTRGASGSPFCLAFNVWNRNF